MSRLNRNIFFPDITAKIAFAAAIAVAWICLSGCVSSGFYLMSDEWCARHPEASAAHCGQNPHDVVQVGQNTGSQNQDDGP